MTPDLATLPPLSKGEHENLADGICIMEAVAYIAGEPWSDHPACACPVIAAFLRNWNDSLNDDDRDRMLRPLIPRLVGTRGLPALEQRRAIMAADWLIRAYTPAWLRAAKLGTQATILESLPEITDFAQCPSLMPTLTAVRNDAAAAWDAAWAVAWAAAWDAARDAALDAARDAALDAARAAARDAAWDAAWDAALAAALAAAWAAAWDAARDAALAAALAAAWAAAWDATRAAARDAARDAAWDAIKPTVALLQQSALDLVGRMIDARDPA